MSINEWGLNEIRLAIKHEKDEAEKAGKPEDAMYGVECYKSAYKAFRSLVLDRHSGLSIRITQKILNRLIDCKPLTVIEDIPEAWKLCEDIHYESKGIKEVYQCVRCGSLFKHVYKDGTVKYEELCGIKDILANHIINPVRFDRAIKLMQDEGVEEYVEIGPGKVLTGFIKKEG